MARAIVIDRSAVEILVDDGGTDVRRARNRRRISELLADATHHGGAGALLLRGGRDRSTLGERDRRGQRPSPRAEILGGELLAEVEPHIVVEPLAREVAEPGIVDVTQE